MTRLRTAAELLGCAKLTVFGCPTENPFQLIMARLDPWLIGLLRRRPRMVVAVAVANKMARIAWALLVKGGPYRARALVAAV